MNINVDEFKNCLEEVKAHDISVIDIRKVADFADYFIICTATSNRHAQTIAEHCMLFSKSTRALHHTENDPDANWLIVDCYDVVIHIMQEQTRAFYKLEELWQSDIIAEDHEPE